jgi:hypothetical protein
VILRPRNPELEREYVEHACAGRVIPAALIADMQGRAVSASSEYVRDPMTVRLGVDHLASALEEPPDAVNRLTWFLEENAELEDFEARQQLMDAIADLTSAYERIRWVQHRLKS